MDKQKIAVISTGNGGQSMAAYFAHLGYTVSLYAREEDRAEMFPEDGVFQLGGVVEAQPVVALVSHHMAEVIRDAHLIMVTTPAQYHHVVAREMAPCLEAGQMVVLNPGRTFGTYEFQQTLNSCGCGAEIVLAEAETFVFACRCTRVAEPFIHGIKSHVRVAAHHSANTSTVVDALNRIFPEVFEPAASVFETGFSNIGMVFHPLSILLNMTRVEAKEKFLFYMDGISPLVANILERLDRERVAVGRAYGVEVLDAFNWLEAHYGSEGDTLYERIQNTPAYQSIYAPVDIDTRYIYEDIMTGCVPVYLAALRAGVETPVIKSAILWASTIYETDFEQNGRNDKVIDYDRLYLEATGQWPPSGPLEK